mgnify:CR=1 FL=1
MATNQFNNIAMITKKSLNVLRNNLVLVPRVNRTYEKEFSQGMGKIGDTVNARVPGFATVTAGKVAVPDGFQDSYVPVTVSQFNTSLRLSSKELALNAEDGDTLGGEFERSVLGPRMSAIYNKMDADGFALYSGFNGSTGTPGTKPTDLQYFLDAKAGLAENAAPVDDQIYAFLSPRTESSMVNGLKGLFQDSTEIAKQYKKGVMGQSAGMSFLMSQNVVNHQTGTWSGTPLINDAGAALASGGTTLPIDGFGGATDSFKKGDVLTVAGVYAVNPVSKVSTGQLMEFTVTADYAATANAMAALPISPAFVTTGPLQNVTALPLDGAVVQIFGHATSYSNKVSAANLVLHRDALAFAAVDLPIFDGEKQVRARDNDLGVSCRTTHWYDGVNDELLIRIDVMYGWAVLRQGFGYRVQA